MGSLGPPSSAAAWEEAELEERPALLGLRGTLRVVQSRGFSVIHLPPRAHFGILWEYFCYSVWWWWMGARSATNRAMHRMVHLLKKFSDFHVFLDIQKNCL